MSLKVYNSLTQKKEGFKPLKAGKVRMYVCGITAYDVCHLGHARAAVAFDVIYRYFLQKKWDLTYVRNYTDIDDKIIARSHETNVPWQTLTERYIQEYNEDMRLLNVLTPSLEPKATGHIPQMIEAIQKLVKAGKAYEAAGSVYYSVRSFPDYGKLSHKNIEELEAGARVEIEERKKDPLDFVLWKAAKPGEPTWESPWGKGRPGWHIECSVMSTHYLGQPFDIHGGGRDLIFPHHENEIAQAEGSNDKTFCRYFLHNGFININAEKMSKSLRNFKTIKEVVAEHTAEVTRYFLMSVHYGSPLDYTEKNVAEAKAACDRYYQLGQRLEAIPLEGIPLAARRTKPPAKQEIEKQLAKSLANLPKKFTLAMEDDFNTAAALGAVFETVRVFNKYLDSEGVAKTPFAGWARAQWETNQKEIREVFGLFALKPQDYFAQLKGARAQVKQVALPWIEQKLAERLAARKAKNFSKADQIRAELVQKGVELKDRPDGTTEWHFR